MAYIIPNISALNIIYKEQYEGTGRDMLLCHPTLVDKYPDWLSLEEIWFCSYYTPRDVEHYYNLDLGLVYNSGKKTIDVFIGVGTVLTVIGVLGKTCLFLFVCCDFGLP